MEARQTNGKSRPVVSRLAVLGDSLLDQQDCRWQKRTYRPLQPFHQQSLRRKCQSSGSSWSAAGRKTLMVSGGRQPKLSCSRAGRQATPSIHSSSASSPSSHCATVSNFNASKQDKWGGGHLTWLQYSRLVRWLSAEVPSGLPAAQPATSDNLHLLQWRYSTWHHASAERLLAVSKLASDLERSQLGNCQ